MSEGILKELAMDHKALTEKYEALAAQLDDAEDELKAVYLILNSIALLSTSDPIGEAYEGRKSISRYMRRWYNS